MTSGIDPTATAELALQAAFSRWALDGNPAWLEQCFRHERAFPGDWNRLLATLRPYLLNGGPYTFGDVLFRIEADAKTARHADQPEKSLKLSDAANLLNNWYEKTQTVSDRVFLDAMDVLLRVHTAKDLSTLSDDVMSGAIGSLADLYGELDRLRVEERPVTAPVNLYFGDPKKEPDLTPPPALIEGLLYRGYVAAFGPWKKSSKTRFFLTVTFALTHGMDFCGRKTEKRRCLWVQRDMPAAVFLDYARKTQNGMEFPDQAIPWLADPIDLVKPEGQSRLIEAVKRHESEVIFLDSARAVTSVKENESDSVREFVRSFICDRLRDQLGLTVVLICHPGKGGITVRGSGDWEAGADSVLRFEPILAGDTVDFVKIHGEGRHPAVEFSFRVDDLTEYGSDGWAVQEAPHDLQKAPKVPEATKGKTRATEAVLAWLKANPGRHPVNTITSGAKVRKEDVGNALTNLLGRRLADYIDGPRQSKLWGMVEELTGSREPVGTSGNQSVGNPVSTGSRFPPPLGGEPVGNRSREPVEKENPSEVIPTAGSGREPVEPVGPVAEREPGEEVIA